MCTFLYRVMFVIYSFYNRPKFAIEIYRINIDLNLVYFRDRFVHYSSRKWYYRLLCSYVFRETSSAKYMRHNTESKSIWKTLRIYTEYYDYSSFNIRMILVDVSHTITVWLSCVSACFMKNYPWRRYQVVPVRGYPWTLNHLSIGLSGAKKRNWRYATPGAAFPYQRALR